MPARGTRYPRALMSCSPTAPLARALGAGRGPCSGLCRSGAAPPAARTRMGQSEGQPPDHTPEPPGRPDRGVLACPDDDRPGTTPTALGPHRPLDHPGTAGGPWEDPTQGTSARHEGDHSRSHSQLVTNAFVLPQIRDSLRQFPAAHHSRNGATLSGIGRPPGIRSFGLGAAALESLGPLRGTRGQWLFFRSLLEPFR